MEIRINSNADIALFLIKGKIGWENSRILDREIHKVIDAGCHHVVFNLDAVSFLCSGGIGALIYNMKKVQEKGGDIYIVSDSDYIQYLFATIGFNVIFNNKIFKTFEDFAGKVLQPKGLYLNLGDNDCSVITTDEHSMNGKAKSLA